MTKEHKGKADTPVENEVVHPGDEKLFDFDKAVPETNDPGSWEQGDSMEKITELEASVAELKEKHLRLLAEFDNYKKRTMRERLDLLNSASREVMISLLPVLDDFDRAKKSADDPTLEETFSEGVALVYNRLYSILQALGLKAMASTGEPFDPDLHEAVTEIPVPSEDQKGKVIDTLERGYFLHDKIIRHAKVVVGN